MHEIVEKNLATSFSVSKTMGTENYKYYVLFNFYHTMLFFQQLAMVEKFGFFNGTEVNKKVLCVKYCTKKKEDLCSCAHFKTRASGLKHRA